MKKTLPSLLLFAVFEAVAVTLWLTLDNPFYLFNFSYIGVSLAVGVALYAHGFRHARRVVQLLVGLYMLVYLGVFEAATIHYAVAKIFGPLLFGRGWCG